MGEETPTGTAARRSILVVPRAPGPLVDPDPPRDERPTDEVDEFFDDLFGVDDSAVAGLLDVALVGGGLALVVWSLVDVHSNGLIVLGGVLVLLGVVLPVRNLWRRWQHHRAERRRAALVKGALVLDVGHPLTRALVAAYEELASEAVAAGARASDVLTAAHLALTETCALLEGRVPSTSAEEAYVERRIHAMDDLTAALRRRPRVEPDARYRTARLLAAEQRDARGAGSLRELRNLTEGAEKDDPDRST